MESESSVHLGKQLALELLHAQISVVATQRALRFCFIKGPGAVVQGLREPKVSGDVDVVVHPEDQSSFSDALVSLGWLSRPRDPDGDRFPNHSVTYYHPLWPVDIDLHFSFPGLESPTNVWLSEALESLEWVDFAHQRCPFPQREAHALILILHGLRDHSSFETHPDLGYLPTVDLDTQKMLLLARRWDALAALRPYIEQHIPDHGVSRWPRPSEHWIFLMTSQTGLSNRVIALGREPWYRWPVVIFRDLFPPKETILANDLHADISARGRAKYYVFRMGRGARRLPMAMKDVFKFRRGRS